MLDQAIQNDELIADAHAGLAMQPKRISPKWFYDERGSVLFEKITKLPEYYPTRTESDILVKNVSKLARLVGDNTVLMELGSGASIKTRVLIEGLPHLKKYAPIDISAEFLRQTASRLSSTYPRLEVTPIAADFMDPISVPASLTATEKLLFFPGSTIGNLTLSEAEKLLMHLGSLSNIRGLLLGVDLVKDPEILVNAYDDSAGVTADFNKNLLARLNREALANFDPENFLHEARWNAELNRIEMHLISVVKHSVTVAGKPFQFSEGESLHTENSHKFTQDSLTDLAASAGWKISELWLDDDALFGVALLVPSK